MKKFKSFLIFALMVLFGASGALLSACGENDDNMQITLSTSHVEIVLGENDNSAVIYATVTDAANKGVKVKYDSSSINVTTQETSDNGVTPINIVAYRQCQNIEVIVEGATKSTAFTVTATTPVSSIIANQNTYAMSYSSQNGGSFQLSQSMFTVLPEGTSQTGLVFSLSNPIDGISIENNVIFMQPGLSDIPTSIGVEVVSAHKDSVRTTIFVDVLKEIDTSLVQIVDASGAALSEIEFSRTNESSVVVTVVVRVPFSLINEKPIVKPKFAYGDRGVILDGSTSYTVESGQYYQYEFDFVIDIKSAKLGTDILWFELAYEGYPDLIFSTANTQNGNVQISVIDEIRDIIIRNGNFSVDPTTPIDIYTSYVGSSVAGLALTFVADPETATNDKLSITVDAATLNYLVIRNNLGQVVQFSEGKYVFDSGTTLYFSARTGFTQGATASIIVSSESQNVDISKTLTFNLLEGVSTLGFVNSTNDGIDATRDFYLDIDQYSTYQVKVAISPASCELLSEFITTSNSDIFTIGQLTRTTDIVNGAVVYLVEITAQGEGEAELNITFPSGQHATAKVYVIENLTDVIIDVEPNFDTSSSVGNITYDSNNSILYAAVKNGQSLPLTFTGNTQYESVAFAFSDYVYDANQDSVYVQDGAYVQFSNQDPETLTFVNTSSVISSNYLRSLGYISPLNVGKVWVRATFTGKQVEDVNGEYVYTDVQVAKYILVEIYNPITSIEIDERNIALYAYDEVGDVNQDLSTKLITLTVNRGGLVPTYNRIDIENVTLNSETGLYEYRYEGNVNFTIEKINDYQFLVRALTRQTQGSFEFSSTTINFVTKDLNLDHNKYSLTANVSMIQPQLVEEVNVMNVGEDGIYLQVQNISNDISLTSFKLVTSVSPSDALNKEVVYRFIPNSGTPSSIISISEDGLITASGIVGGSGIIRVIPKDSVFTDDNGHEYYRDGYVYADVEIFVADGRSRETALRIHSLDDMTNSSLHYVLLSDVIYSSESQIFATFSGGLYGSLDGSTSVASITMNSSNNLFGTLTFDARVEDLIIAGSTKAKSMLADTNAGTISNVTVDVYIDANSSVKISTVENVDGNAGGIVEINTGTIQDTTFAGSISATEIAGGIAAINSGTITSSCVLFYNMQDMAMQINGSLVGAIVGDNTGTIRQSYAFNFSSQSISNSTNVGAIVGRISSTSALITQSFADVGELGNFYAELDSSVATNELTNIIRDSYTIAKTTQDQQQTVTFSYYMTTLLGGRLNGQTSDTSTTYPAVGMDTPSSTWSRQGNSNYGFPYLTAVRPVESMTSEQIQALSIVQSRLSLPENNRRAIMFVYRTTNVNLTEREQQILNLQNTIDYGELFGTYSLNGIIVTSSDQSIISTSNSSLTVKNTGNVTLTVTSKYDYIIAPIEIEVAVIFYTSNFNLTYHNQQLGSLSTINIRTRVNETLTSSLENSIVLVDRQVSLQNNNFIVRTQTNDGQNADFVVGSTIGLHTIVANFEGDETTIFMYLELASMDDGYLEILRNYSQKEIVLTKVYGPISLQTSASEAQISASDRLLVYVDVTSDTSFAENNNDQLKVEVTDSLGSFVDSSVVIVEFDHSGEIISNDTQNGTMTKRYAVTISLNTNAQSYDVSYNVKFSTNSIELYDDIQANLKITVLDQEVLRVDVNHYAFRANGESGVTYYNYYPNNVLSPNSTGLLDVMVYPSYANYTHITVTSQPTNGQSINFLNMRQNGGGYSANLANTFEYINNGILIYAQNTDQDIARYYVRVSVPASVTVDSVYSIVINVYNGDDVVYTTTYSLIIVPQEQAGITVDGNSTIYAVRGETITADVVWDQTQTIKEISAINMADTNVANGISISSIVNSEIEEYATRYFRASIDIAISESSNHFRVRVITSRTLNGVEQTVESYLIVYLIDFELDFANTHIANEEGSDVVTGDKYFYHSLDFNFAGRYIVNEDETQSYSERMFNQFVDNKYYNNNNYEVNLIARSTGTLIENLYYVNGNTHTPVVVRNGDELVSVSTDVIREFTVVETNGVREIRFIGNNNGSQDMLLSMQVVMPDGTVFTYSYYFTIIISDPTSDDSPAQISNAQEFLNAVNGETEEDYILTNDIYLYEYTTQTDTSKIRSLDGNGYQIVIVGFDYDNNSQDVRLSLFNTISSNTTLKNIRLNLFHSGVIQILSAFTNNVMVAPFAITNNGIITNCEVVSYRKLTNEITPSVNGLNIQVDSTIGVSAITAGFVVYNNGIITNSRVGGESVVEYSFVPQISDDGILINTGAVNSNTRIMSPFVISSFGEIAGFVYQNSNSGHIVSSYASNIRLINNSNIDYATITAGFVIQNAGLVSMSYAKGVKQDESDIHASMYGIETSGISAGFAYENSGEINNSYSNISLTNLTNNPGRNSAGFVYRNTQTGVISTSLSLSRIVGSTTTQMNFSGVDDYGNYQNFGSIENSYYYDEVSLSDSSIMIESAYGESAEYVSNALLQEYFYGFSFASGANEEQDDGIWKMTSSGPELVSANQIAVSLRYASQQDTNARPVFTYVDEFRYGSKNNPILIRSAEEFSRVFSGTDNSSASRYVNTQTGQIFGSYRLINDIDLNQLVTDSNNTYQLATSNMELTGMYRNQGDGNSVGWFDGNGLTISGLALSDPDVSSRDNFGLFASITSGAMVQNVNLVLGSTNAGGDVFGVEAAGVKYVGALAGTVDNASVINVSVTSLYSNTNSVTVRGRNVVGGLIGRVVGDSFIFNLQAQDISVTASMNPTNYTSGNYLTYNRYNRTSDILNSSVSYAGGVVGVLDAYTDSSINIENFAETEVTSDGNAVMLKTLGTSIISGGTVGGVVGYVGALTVLQDAVYELSYVDESNYLNQGLYSYNGFAGGVVGVNLGYIRQVRSEHEYTWQIGDSNPDDEGDDSVEANITNYYNGQDVDRGNTALFESQNYTPIAIGGLVGLEVSGKIEKSYSKLNVIYDKTDNRVYAGGIVGMVESTDDPNVYVDLNINEVYASGDVQAYSAGGIVGYAKAKVVFDKVNAINYWGEWLLNETGDGTAYAILNKQNDVEITYVGQVTAFSNNSIVFTSADQSTVPTNSKFIADSSIPQTIKSLKDNISGYGDDGANFDIYFTGNNWDRESWKRDTNELYPHILFGYRTSLIYITKQEDIERMRTAREGDVFIINPDQNDSRNDVTGDHRYVGITTQIAPITSFNATLRGLDSRYDYGFVYTGTTATRALFSNAVGATFSNFSTTYNNSSFSAASLGQNGVLIGYASNTSFTDITFNNLNVTLNPATTQFGFVAGYASGACTIRNIEVNDSSISAQGNISSSLALGFVLGDSSLGDGAFSGVKIQGSNINFENIRTTTQTTQSVINVGLVAGNLSASATNMMQITLDGAQGAQQESFSGIVESSIVFSNTTSSQNPINNARIGLLFGSLSGAQLSSEGLEIDLDFAGIEFSSSRIGGLIGFAQNCNFEDISAITNNLNVTAGDSYIGGIVGYIQNCQNEENGTITNNSGDNSKITVQNIALSENSGSPGNFVGGIFGRVDGALNNNTYIYSLNDVSNYVDITVSNPSQQLYVGGIVGNLNTMLLNNTKSFADISIQTISSQAPYIITAGAIVGSSNNAQISNSHSFGDVKHVVSNNADYSDVSLEFGGIVGRSENGITINSSSSVGNFYPSYYQNGDNNFIKSYQVTLNSLIYGGLVGNGTAASLSLESNNTLSTLFNRFEREITTKNEDGTFNYHANALVGTGETDQVGTGENISTYAHVATLLTDTIGANDSYINVRASILEKLGLTDNDINGQTGDNIYGKLKYSTDLSENTSVQTKYVYLGSADTATVNWTFGTSLKNTMVIADGYTVNLGSSASGSTFRYDNTNKNIVAPFGTIDENSSVSGIVVIANYFARQSQNSNLDAIAGFAMQNNGIIYSSNVKGQSAITTQDDASVNLPNKITAQIDAGSAPVSGFVGINGGLVKDSFANVLLTTTYTGAQNNPIFVGKDTQTSSGVENQDVGASGFVATNSGLIVNSYSSGSIDAENAVKANSQIALYLFSPGKVYDSYTNMQVVFDEVLNVRQMIGRGCQLFAFDSSSDYVNGSYYDTVAAQFVIQDGSNGVATDGLSMVYGGTTQPSTPIGSFTYDQSQAYGYGSFSGGAYENMDYMHHDTGEGTLENPYQIPNLGKLYQLRNFAENENLLYFNLVSNINASYAGTQLGNWTSFDIQNINLNGYDSLTQDFSEISNLTSRGGGMFDQVTNSNISNMRLNNIGYANPNGKPYIGALANEVFGASSSISGIILSDIDIDEYSSQIFDNYIYVGGVVGRLGENATLENCSIIEDSFDQDAGFNIVLPHNKSLIFGGFVGLVEGGTITGCNISRPFTATLSTGTTTGTPTYIVGGIAGMMTSGTIQNCTLNTDMMAAATAAGDSRLQATADANSATIYVGGIVGVVGEKVDNQISNSANSGTISNCFVASNATIIAGNAYNVKTAYVGGISGFGGTILNCYNNASRLVGIAKYNYTSPSDEEYLNSDYEYNNGRWEERTEEIAYTHTKIYTNATESLSFNRSKKLTYGTVEQHAYVAGIANSYDNVDYVVNNCEYISGGLDARRAIGYYDVDTDAMNRITINSKVWLNAALAAFKYAKSVGALSHLIRNIAIGVGIVAGYKLFNTLNSDVSVDQYYMDGSGYQYTTDSTNYYDNNIFKNNRDAWDLILQIFSAATIGMGDLIQMTESTGLDFPVGSPNYQDVYMSALDEFFTGDDWVGLSELSLDDGLSYIYNSRVFEGKNSNLYVYDVYSHSIGSPAITTGTTGNVAWKEGVMKEVPVMTNSGMSTNLYNFNDYTMLNEYKGLIDLRASNSQYSYLWEVSNDVLEKLDGTTYSQTNSYGSTESWGDDWIEVDGNIVNTNSPEYQTTTDGETINNAETDGETATITVQDVADYRGAVNVVNAILGESAENPYNPENVDTDKLNALKTAVNSGNITIVFAPSSNGMSLKLLDFAGYSVGGFGTDDMPFSGTLTAQNYSGVELTGFSPNSNSNALTTGLVNNAGDVEISNINISYSSSFTMLSLNNAAQDPIKKVGGFVGKVQNGGNVTITNSTVAFVGSDYNKNGQRSTQKLDVGGFVGYLGQNATLDITYGEVENFDVNLTGSLSDNSANSGIGGLVGNMAQGSTVTINSNLEINLGTNGIQSNSSNNVAGGAVGIMQGATLSGNGTLTLSSGGNIQVENTSGTSSYAGGVVGYMTGSNTIDFALVDIQLRKISATTAVQGATTYAGGVIGAAQNAPTISGIITVGLDQYDVTNQTIISSGIGGSEYSNLAYADVFGTVIGNNTTSRLEIANATVNARAMAFADPKYDPDPSLDILKPSQDPISSRQVVRNILENTTTTNNGNTEKTGEEFFTVDVFEYPTQVTQNIENAYINGEAFTLYNYQKYVYIIITKGTTAFNDDFNTYSIKESVYRLSISGQMSDGDFDIVNQTSLEFVTAHSFMTTSPIYRNAVQSGVPIYMSERGDDFVPNQINSNNLVNTDAGIDDDIEMGGSVQTISSYSIRTDGDGNSYIDMQESIKGTRSNITINDTTGDSLTSPNVTNEETSVTYGTITLTDEALVLEYQNGNGGVVLENTLYTLLSNNIYSDVSSINGNITLNTTMGSEKIDINSIKNTEQLKLDIKLNNGNYSLQNQSTESDISFDIVATLSNTIRVDGQRDRQYRVIFLSVYNGTSQIAQNISGYLYQEYVYLTDGTNLYYLGDISYVTDSLIEDFVNISRNAQFFPNAIAITNHKNNLKSLSQITDPISSYSDFPEITVTTHNTVSEYYIDASTPITNGVYQIIGNTSEVQIDYTLMLDNIVINSINSVEVNFTCTQTERESGGNEEISSTIALGNTTWNIVNANVYEDSVSEDNLLSNTLVLQKQEVNDGTISLTTEIYHFDFSNGDVLTGFTLYTTGDFTVDRDDNYIITGNGTSYGPDGSSAVANRSDDENGFGYDVTLNGSNTIVELTEGDVTQYFQLPGSATAGGVEYRDDALTIRIGDCSYQFRFNGTNFILNSYTFTQSHNNESYTITETHTSQTEKTISISYGTSSNTVGLTDSSWQYITGGTISQPTVVDKFFSYSIEDYISEVTGSEGIINITARDNQTILATFERETLLSIDYFSANFGDVEAQVYVDSSNHVVVLVKNNGEWATLKDKNTDVYLDFGGSGDLELTNVTVMDKGGVTVVRLSQNGTNLDYDITNGYILASVVAQQASSRYSDQTLDYTKYNYDTTYINGIESQITKIIYDTVTLEVNFGVNSVELIPFNNDYAIRLTDATNLTDDGTNNAYFTMRAGNEISGTVGEEQEISSSLGVQVPNGGVYVLLNNATILINNDNIAVTEYVYIRNTEDTNWYSGLNDGFSIVYESTDEEGTTQTISRAQGTCTTTDGYTTFTERLVTTTGSGSVTVVYNWSFRSGKVVEYYQVSRLSDLVNNYNRYTSLGLVAGTTSGETSNIQQSVFVLDGGRVLDVVFGMMTYSQTIESVTKTDDDSGFGYSVDFSGENTVVVLTEGETEQSFTLSGTDGDVTYGTDENNNVTLTVVVFDSQGDSYTHTFRWDSQSNTFTQETQQV